MDYNKPRIPKSGHVRRIDMRLVMPKQTTVEAGHTLNNESGDTKHGE